MTKHPKRPRDPNQLAKAIADLATGETSEPAASPMATLGRAGGRRGGRARADALTPARRKEIAEAAAAARWSKLSNIDNQDD
jgi:hypothetical protein